MKYFCYIFLLLLSCNPPYRYEFIYDPQLYNPITYTTECTDPFEFEPFVVDTILANRKERIYKTCEKDSIVKGLFSENKYAVPSYRGTLNHGSTPHIVIFSFVYQPQGVPLQTKGYLWIKQYAGSEVTLFRAFENMVDDWSSLSAYYKNGYILLIEKNNPWHDVTVEGGTKEIVLRYCILSLQDNSDIRVLNKADGSKVLTSHFDNIQKDL